jgi:hypothetical protein
MAVGLFTGIIGVETGKEESSELTADKSLGNTSIKKFSVQIISSSLYIPTLHTINNNCALKKQLKRRRIHMNSAYPLKAAFCTSNTTRLIRKLPDNEQIFLLRRYIKHQHTDMNVLHSLFFCF